MIGERFAKSIIKEASYIPVIDEWNGECARYGFQMEFDQYDDDYINRKVKRAVWQLKKQIRILDHPAFAIKKDNLPEENYDIKIMDWLHYVEEKDMVKIWFWAKK